MVTFGGRDLNKRMLSSPPLVYRWTNVCAKCGFSSVQRYSSRWTNVWVLFDVVDKQEFSSSNYRTEDKKPMLVESDHLLRRHNKVVCSIFTQFVCFEMLSSPPLVYRWTNVCAKCGFSSVQRYSSRWHNKVNIQN
jgi:ribosomal protein L37E